MWLNAKHSESWHIMQQLAYIPILLLICEDIFSFLSCQVIRLAELTFVISISENSVENIQFTISLSLAGNKSTLPVLPSRLRI